jgi:hypothetical protein
MTEIPAGYPDPSALILVGILPGRKDLEIARLLGWYRIPLRFAPKIVNVDVVAFYQASVFGREHQWRIESFASVRGVELTTRKELLKEEPDHPRANEEYYKLELGPLQVMGTPILAGKWKRITFLYTTGELFYRAKTINDLVVKTEERMVLWRSIRERALQGNLYRAEDIPEFQLDPAILALLGDFNHLAKPEGPVDEK